MKKSILLPTDFSDNSWNAIVYALHFFKTIACDFYLLNVYDTSSSYLSNVSNRDDETEIPHISKKSSLKNLQEFEIQMRAAEINPDYSFTKVSKPGELTDVIKKAVLYYDIDLVVLANKGLTASKEFMYGSNTIKVVNKMRLCPVLIIPEDFDFEIPNQIAFPSDFNRFYNYIEFKPLTDIASIHNSKIRILHINVEEKLNDVQAYNMATLKSYLEGFEYSFHWMPDYTKKTKEINDFLEDLQIDMLAMVNYKHSFFEKIIKEPVIKKISFHPLVPFLVIPD
jgi:nucleotide-binding universal stress UspA family protein